MPLPPPPALAAALQAKAGGPKGPADLMKAMQAKQAAAAAGGGEGAPPPVKKAPAKPTCPEGKLFHYDESLEAFLIDHSKNTHSHNR